MKQALNAERVERMSSRNAIEFGWSSRIGSVRHSDPHTLYLAGIDSLTLTLDTRGKLRAVAFSICSVWRCRQIEKEALRYRRDPAGRHRLESKEVKSILD